MQKPDCDPRRYPNCAPRRPGALRDISKYFFCFDLCVRFFQTVTKLLGHIPNKLFGPNDLKTRSGRYFVWPKSGVKKLLRR